MVKLKRTGRLSLTALALAAAGAAPVAPPAPPATAPSTGPATRPSLATSKDLGGTDRYLSYIATDKPIYRANEKVYVRAILLNAATHMPLGDDKQAQAQVTILGPRGETVASGGAQSENSVVGFSWTVPEGASGGEYTFKIAYPFQGYAPSERKFDVRIYRAPRLRNQITFARDGYGVGDKVTATVHSERAEGGFPAGAKVTVTARVDDMQVYTGPASIDAKGDCTATFALPKEMERGEGTLAFAIEDGGVVETAAKTIPILLQTLDLAVYPEGGDPIAYVDDRFYVQAWTPSHKPADFTGIVVDSKGVKVADLKTEHEGRARFNFRAGKGETYTLKVVEPAGISKTWKLPEFKDVGVAIESLDNVVGAGKPLRLRLTSNGTAGPFKVTLSKREAAVAEPLTINMAPGGFDLTNVAEFPLKPEIDGVLTATVWNDKGEPLAERLIYRQPAHQINVQVTPNQSTYTPGGKAALNIITTDESGKPIAATVGLTVTDDTIQEMLETRDKAPRLPVMVFLEPEVKDLADAQVYLDPKNPKAALDTDLLLGTQGWRRFATYRADEFMAKYGDDAKRVLAYMKPEPQVMDEIAFDMDGAAAPGGGVKAELRFMPAAAAMPQPLALQADNLKDKLAEAPAPPDRPAAADKQLAQGLQPAATRPMAPIVDQKQMMRRIRPGFNPGELITVREYAHPLRDNWSPTDRTDFTETVYWNAGIKTDDAGKATATFNLADSVTTFRVFADAFSKAGALGTSSSTVQSVQPFFIEPKIPLEVTVGDVIELPISVTNNTNTLLQNFALTVTAPGNLNIQRPKGEAVGVIGPNDRMREVFYITVGDKVGDVPLTLSATAGEFSDKVTRTLRVKPKGFPTQLAFGGLVNKDTPASKQIVIPNSVVANSMTTFATVYPSPMANLTDAVAALMREPNGCFEQTSSTNYPLAMAQMYFVTHQGVDPKLAAQGQVLLGKGYQRLTSFECKDKGYEWFGGTTPGHEALTAYGLMEFHDMQAAGLATVDDQMVARTRTWLISREDPKGGFLRNQKSCDSFGAAPELTTNAYIVWALLQAGETPQTLASEVTFVRDAAKTSTDSYVLALAANICQLTKDSDNAVRFMEALAKKQNKDGGVDGGLTSITRSGGQALAIETTALATLAWMQNKDFAGNNQDAIKFLADSCKGGRFGSTQSTILALKAIVAADQANAHPKAPGSVSLYIDNKPFGKPQEFTADSKGPMTFDSFASELPPGPHNIDLRMTDGSEMPFSLGATFNSLTPATDKQCKLDLQTTLKDAQLAEGSITEMHVEVTNKTDKDAASPVAIVGIPGGLAVRHDQLKELVKAGTIDAYEVNGREVVLYWRQIKAGIHDNVSLSLTADVPGTYTAPASRAYEYYTDEFKQWQEGTAVTISAK